MPNTNTSILANQGQSKQDLGLVKTALDAGEKAEKKSSLEALECLVELKDEDLLTQIQYRDCVIDYTTCPNSHCIKNLT